MLPFKSYLFVTCLFVSLTTLAQQMSLNDCIAYAMDHRTELDRQYNEVAFRTRQVSYTKHELLPTVYSEIYHQYSSGRSLNINTYEWGNSAKQQGSLSLNADLILFDGLQSFQKIKQSKLLLARNKSYLAKLKNDIRAQVIRVYCELQTVKGNINILQNGLTNLESQINKTTIAVKAGKTSTIDLLELQARQEKQHNDLLDALLREQTATLSLQKAINFTGKIETPIADETDSALLFQPVRNDIVFQQALSTLPQIEISMLDSAYWQRSIIKANGLYSPVLKLSGTWASQYLVNAIDPVNGSGKYSFGDQLNNNRYLQAGLTLTIPIYNRHANKSQITENVKSLNQSLMDKKQLFHDIFFEVEGLCNEIKSKQMSILHLKNQVNLYTKVFQMRRKQYNEGALSITDLMVAESNYTEALLRYNNTCHDTMFLFELLKIYTTPN